MKIEKLAQSVVIAFLGLVTQGTLNAADKSTQTDSTEKCYGIVKAGMNDCATSKSSCAGSATKNSQSDAFVFMPKGLCEKLVGGKLKSS